METKGNGISRFIGVPVSIGYQDGTMCKTIPATIEAIDQGFLLVKKAENGELVALGANWVQKIKERKVKPTGDPL